MLGERMKALRLSKKLTLEQLAISLNEKYPDTVNFNKGKLSKWENNKEEPKLSSIRILADYYGIGIDDLYSTKEKSTLSIENVFNQLEPSRQEKVYSFAKKQLVEQNSVIPLNNSKKKESEVYTLAAHSSDPDKKYTEEEIKHIQSVLAEARKKHLNKNDDKE
ncbi:helix-turn-helix domain-containing protein [Enterococcus thailandicus]|uniref:helix-turn-helix domain-containing protein n=1 Tax=Enterococcus TaxID=1350 RepID=UPI000A355A79|nr:MULTISPECIES: helix-turn-helix transcriptional regulator [Enterococcus]MDK4353322.1 helix-turn-helix domain-containing protein [Enterococcus thailandicus]MDT2752911.1 helix-turn-helix transcriptional regulator [Enterococcus thailandicus]MDT2774938.1 helix-turn-helix transcriptional regulator [Enterococcus thailandicus]OTP23822.1 hypothetical protein A5800_001679 [Enterococcus sp. 5B7_DIV0075]